MKAQLPFRGILFFCIFVMASAVHAFSQALKLGYVDSQVIIQQYPEAQDAQKKLDAFQTRIQDSLQILNKQYQEKINDYQQKETLMSEQAKKAAQQELALLEKKFLEARERKLGRDGELTQMSEKLLKPIREKIIRVIQQVAKEEKLSFVFDKTEAVQIILYGDSAFDYTFKVIDKLKRGK